MRLAADDIITRAHAEFGSADAVIEQRRAVYQLPIELLALDGRGVTNSDVLDNPMSRGHLGAVLSGLSPYDGDALSSLAELAVEPVVLAGCTVRVAGSPTAPSALADAVHRIGTELGRHGPDARPLVVLTSDQPAFAPGHRRFLDGVELAVRVAPGLALDLLAHVALFGMLEPHSSGRLGSASAREYPGLVLLPAPISAVEAAEALIHEGAHQKFFDLAITRAIFGPNQDAAPGFAPSWTAEATVRSWPLEQTFAACHAYCCLAAFAEALSGLPEPAALSTSPRPVPLALPASSLLPEAAERAAEIGQWLSEHRQFLGPDGQHLLTGLLGQRQAGQGRAEGYAPTDVVTGGASWIGEAMPGEAVIARLIGDRMLVARLGDPVELFWSPVLRTRR
jgi:hypothetical protein